MDLRGRIDVVHCWPRATLATAAAARRLGVASVRELPNAHTGYAYDVVRRELQRLGLPETRGHSHTHNAAALALEENEFRAVDRLAAPSEFVRQTFLERGFDAARLARHRYGFDPAAIPLGRDAERGRDGLEVLFIGRCEPRKGLHYALRAWHESGAAERGRFRIFGEFYPGYRKLLSGLLNDPSVEVHPFTSDPASAMRSSDVLVLPTVEEGSALVTYEAQAAGCVLAVSEAAGAYCEHGRHGLVHPVGDVETLTAHLRTLDLDRALLGELRRNALAHRSVLTWAAAATALEALYREAIGSKEA